jgi:hypothetical protein
MFDERMYLQSRRNAHPWLTAPLTSSKCCFGLVRCTESKEYGQVVQTQQQQQQGIVFQPLGKQEQLDIKQLESDNPSKFKDRSTALAASGDVRLHKKGGIYRVLYRDVQHADDSSIVFTVYEHLFPHANLVYARPQKMFDSVDEQGVTRFARVT